MWQLKSGSPPTGAYLVTCTHVVADNNSITTNSECRYPGQNFLLWRRHLRKAEFAVLTALQTFADREGNCWPSRKKLSELTGYHVTKISKITTRLVELGILEKIGRGGRSSCRYRVLVSKYYAPEKLVPIAEDFPGDFAGARGATPPPKKVVCGIGVTAAVTPGGHPEDAVELSKNQLQHLEEELQRTQQELKELRVLQEAERQKNSQQIRAMVEKIRSSQTHIESPEKTNQNRVDDTQQEMGSEPGSILLERDETPPPVTVQNREKPTAMKEKTPPSGADEALIFPPGIEPVFALALLGILDDITLKQRVLDELAGQLKSNHIRNPYGYLKTLAERAINGHFIPNAGIRIAKSRQRQTAGDLRLRQAEAAIDQRLKEYEKQHSPAPPERQPRSASNPLREWLSREKSTP